MTEAHGLILPVGQSFVAAAQQSNPSNPIPETRRSTLALNSPFNVPATGWEDFCSRFSFTLPVAPTRCRFRIRNSDLLTNSTTSQSVVLTGVWWGTPNVAAEPYWLGDFTAAPTQVYAGSTQDLATELVTPWFTPPASAVANAFQGVSIGGTVSVDSELNLGAGPSISWHSATVVGCASAAGNAAAPGVGTETVYTAPLDIRMEFEFIGRNQIGLILGDSLSVGVVSGGAVSQLTKFGPDASWPQIAANRLGHLAINGGIGSASTATFLSTAALAWSRFDLGPNVNSGVSCIPDYAVIELGVNDIAGVGAFPYLPLFQQNIQTIVANLLAVGIKRVYVATVPPSFTTALSNQQGGQGAILKTAITAGALGTVSGVGPVTSTTAQGGAPGGGSPGVLTEWFVAGNVETVTTVAVTNTLSTITVVSGGFPNVTPGMLIQDSTTAANITEGTQVVSISGNTLTMNKPAAGTGVADTLTFSSNGLFFELPTSGLAEGPFPITAASGTTTLTLTAAGTTTKNHAAGCPIFTMPEGCRQAMNLWIRNGVPNTLGMADFASISEMSGKPAVVAVGDPSVPFSSQAWEFYQATSSPHPSSPGLYARWAKEIAAMLAGI